MAVNQSLVVFFDVCQRDFTFLEAEYGFVPLCGLSEYYRGRQIITTNYDLTSTGYPFFATARYELDDFFIELSYGDYNFTIDCHVTYKKRYRFRLKDIVKLLKAAPDAAPIQFSNDDDPDIAPQDHHVLSLLQTYRQFFMGYLNDLMTLPDSVLLELLDTQDRMLEKRLREKHAREKSYACQKAEAAFLECDYKKTIMLYRPYKDGLEPHEYRIFSLAILYLDQ